MADRDVSSVDEVCNFLYERGVADEVVEKFKEEKMDAIAVAEASELDVQQLGLQRRGDIIALKAHASNVLKRKKEDEERADKKRKLLAMCRLPDTRKSKKNKPEEERTRAIQCGWMHFNEVKGRYVPVRLPKGGGTRNMNVSPDQKVHDLLIKMKSVFFPDGVCYYGDIANMLLDIGNFKGDVMTNSDITVADYIAKHGLSRVRLYILTKPFLELGSASDDNDDDLQESVFNYLQPSSPQSIAFIHSAPTSATACTSSTFTATSNTTSSGLSTSPQSIALVTSTISAPTSATACTNSTFTATSNTTSSGLSSSSQSIALATSTISGPTPASASTSSTFTATSNTGTTSFGPSSSNSYCTSTVEIEDDTSLLIGTSADRSALKEEQNNEYMESLAADRLKEEARRRQENLKQARQMRVVRTPSSSEPKVTVSVRHLTLGIVTRTFSIENNVSAIYDWVGSLSLVPEHFALTTHKANKILPSQPISSFDKAVLYMSEKDESPEFPEEDVWFLGYGSTSSDPNNTIETPWSDIPVLDNTSGIADILLEGDEMLSENGSESYSSGDGGLARFIKLRRVNIKQDMIDQFKDPLLMNQHIKVIMINSNGKEEGGSDVNGVFRDALSAFWTAFEDSCTIGEDERIPFLNHAYQGPEWEAIARILVKGYLQLNFFPIKLNKAFLAATMFGEHSVSQELLLQSFLAYLSNDERNLVKHALDDSLDSDQQDEWIEFLDRFGCKRIPRQQDECKEIIMEIAHKEQIQTSKYVIDCWQKELECLKSKIATVSDLNSIFNMSMPTNKKVIDLLKPVTEPNTNAQRDALAYLKRYLRGLDAEKLRKALRYLTGANVICVAKIEVVFTSLVGFERRPIARTCGPTLELPSTYESFPEFREEFNNILNSDFWDIDFA